jgi:outer membrane cobalamin receptor
MSQRILWALFALVITSGIVLPANSFAAEAIRGRVVGRQSDGAVVPLRGATVKWKNSATGTIVKNADGTFALDRVASTDTLEVRFVSYITAFVVIERGRDTIEVRLLPSASQEVVVEAEESAITRAPVKTEVITKKDLAKAACCSLAESFEKNPSVEVSFADAVTGAKQVQLLGLRGTYTQMLIEAVPLPRALETPFGLDHVPGPFMESISIAKGSSTVTNGYESITGQINLCMHNPSTSPTLYVNAYANTQQRYELNLYGAQRVTDELSTMTMLHGRIMDEAMDQNNDGFADIPTFRQVNLVHRWMYNNDEIEWQFFIRGLQDRYVSGQSIVHDAMFEQHDSTWGRPYDVVTDIGRVDGFVKFGLLNPFTSMEEGSGISLVVAGVYHDASSTFGLRSARGLQRTINVRGVVAAPFTSDVKLVAGFSYLYDDVQERLEARNLSRIEHVPGAYAELTLQPHSSLTLLAGLRADAHNLYGTRLVPRAHAKWSVTDMTSIRVSAGRGWRVANVVMENLGSYVNSRQVIMDPSFLPEDAWNVGASLTTSFELAGRPFTFDAEVYTTRFTNQVYVDYDRSVRELWVTNLRGESYSTNIMTQLLFSPVPRLDVLLAYRWVDVQAPYGGQMQQRPLVSRSRVLTTMSYATEGMQWQGDVTLAWNGSGRFPTTEGNMAVDRRSETFPGMWRLNAQITRRFDGFDLYMGIENALNMIQRDPIIGADSPYTYRFDASLAWGQLDSRMVYVGVRYTLE